jgi:WD40 repeat protein
MISRPHGSRCAVVCRRQRVGQSGGGALARCSCCFPVSPVRDNRQMGFDHASRCLTHRIRQATCCTAHTSEALRVTWSPDGGRLATGGADGLVKLWRWEATARADRGAGGPAAAVTTSYGGEELATFEGHPEEVYALEFVARGGGNNGGSGGGPGGEWLVAGSGESLFLWDVEAGRMVQEVTPPAPPTDGCSSGAAAAAGGEPGAGEEQREGFPPYVFSLAAQRGAAGASGLMATACCDGGVRLWQLGAARLELVADAKVGRMNARQTWIDVGIAITRASTNTFASANAHVQVHPTDMGSACAFSPSRPSLLACLSKGGELVLLDVRRLPAGGGSGSSSGGSAAVVARQRLAGPVFGCAWLPAGAFGGGGEQLAVVGADSVVRLYEVEESGEGGTQRWTRLVGLFCIFAPWDALAHTQNTTLRAGSEPLREPLELQMPGGYEGKLLTVAVSSSSSSGGGGGGVRIAAAGEPVGYDQLTPLSASRAAPTQLPPGGAPTAAAAAVAGAVGRRRRGQKGRAVVLDSFEGSGGMFDALSIGSEREQSEQQPPSSHHSHDTNGPSMRAPLYIFEQV